MSNQLIEKYRPKTLDEIVGQDKIVKAVRANLGAESRSHSFLFTGAFGCGKTTFAKAIAHEVGALNEESSIIYVNASAGGGVDDTRGYVDNMSLFPLDGSISKVLIIDECHELSKKAWSPFLDILENPPEHAYFIFCTSESDKVNKAVLSRTPNHFLDRIPESVIFDYLTEVIAVEEEILIPIEAFELVSKEANGSMRQALTYLGTVRGVETLEEAQDLIKDIVPDADNPDAYKLGQMIFYQRIKDFTQYIPVIESLIASPRSAWGGYRITLLGVAASVMMRAKSTQEAIAMAEVFNDIKQMKPFFDDERALKAELIEVCLCSCLHLP